MQQVNEIARGRQADGGNRIAPQPVRGDLAGRGAAGHGNVELPALEGARNTRQVQLSRGEEDETGEACRVQLGQERGHRTLRIVMLDGCRSDAFDHPAGTDTRTALDGQGRQASRGPVLPCPFR